jgi:hypothetical protein
VAETSTEALKPHVESDQTAVAAADRRKTAAVDAYCGELLAPKSAPAAAIECLATFNGSDYADLLRHTGKVAVRHAAPPSSRRRWRMALAGEARRVCESAPQLLVAIANHELGGEQRERLERHLASCLTCQATELRICRAERAFAGIAGVVLPARERDPAEVRAAPFESATVATTREVPTAEDVPVAEPTPRETTPILERQAPPAGAETPSLEEASAPAEESSLSEDVTVPPLGEDETRIEQRRLPVGEVEEPPPRPRFRRRGTGIVVAAVGLLAIAAVGGALALSVDNSKHQTAARTTTPVSPITTPASAAPKPRKPAAILPHDAAKKPTAHRAAPVTPTAPAVAAVPATSSPAPAAPQSATSSPAPPQSAATPSSAVANSPASVPAPAPTPAPSSPPPSPPSVSIQQGSLGSTNAPQGVGK